MKVDIYHWISPCRRKLLLLTFINICWLYKKKVFCNRKPSLPNRIIVLSIAVIIFIEINWKHFSSEWPLYINDKLTYMKQLKWAYFSSFLGTRWLPSSEMVNIFTIWHSMDFNSPLGKKLKTIQSFCNSLKIKPLNAITELKFS